MKQRYNECALASVCALTGNDYVTASDLFKEVYGVSWWDSVRQGNLLNLRDFLTYLAPKLDQYSLFYGSVPAKTTPDLSGKGILIIGHHSGVRHGMAFADGIIWDSNYDSYGTLDEIMAQPGYEGFYVESVARESDTTQ